jgi:hypothetical protein
MNAITFPVGIFPGTFVVMPMVAGALRWLFTTAWAALTPEASPLEAAELDAVVDELLAPELAAVPDELHPATTAARAAAASTARTDLGTAIFLRSDSFWLPCSQVRDGRCSSAR